MSFKETLFLITLTFCEIYCANTTTCTLWDHPTVDTTPPNFEQFVNYLKAQMLDLDIISDMICTKAVTVLDALLYQSSTVDEDIKLNITQLITKYGFPVEVHEVTTEDGYILTMHRIPGTGKPVLLAHGILMSAVDWITNGPEYALPYYLAKKGYDVWLFNARGNKYSRKHETLTTDCVEFWDFSWHEIGVYDLPSSIDYILEKTGYDNLSYIGHSQGATAAFVMGSLLPDYNKKLNVFIAFAPAAWLCHTRSPIFRFLSLNPGFFYTLYGDHEVDQNNVFTETVSNIICANNPLGKVICANSIYELSGFGCGRLNIVNVPVIKAHKGSGSSVKQLVHYGQVIRSCEFKQFDYGTDKNKDVYGTEEPPAYEVEKVSAKVALFYSYYDWLVNATDVDTLKGKLPNVIASNVIDHFNHVDFLFGKDLVNLLFTTVLGILQTHG